MNDRACRSCLWWNKARRASWTDTGPSGSSFLVEHAQCRRYAPGRVSSKDQAVPDRVWPHVNATDWCGDFTPRQPRQ